MADALAYLDVYTSHALYARNHRYVQAKITRDGSIAITQARHPVIEANLSVTESFIPNDLHTKQEIHVIT